MVRFMSLASGSSGNCYYVATPLGAILIDAGIPARSISKTLTAQNIPIEGHILAILVTHEHGDHVRGLSTIAHQYNLPIYTTAQVHKALDGLTYYKSMADLPRIPVVLGETFSLIGLEITPFAIPHDSRANIGYRFTRGKFSMALLTDVGHITSEIRHYTEGVKHLILESNYDPEMLWLGRYPQYLKDRVSSGWGHLSNVQSAEFLAEMMHPELQNVWLCHLSKDNNHPELCRKTHLYILGQRHYQLPPNFRLYTLGRNSTSELFELEE